MPIVIRKAVESDVDWLVDQLFEFAAEFERGRAVLDNEDYMRFALPKLMEAHLFFVAELDGGRVGFICGLVLPHVFNPKIRTLHEMFWWTMLEHRESGCGTALLEAFVSWGKSNVDWVYFTLNEKHRGPELALIGQGFRALERHYFLEVT